MTTNGTEQKGGWTSNHFLGAVVYSFVLAILALFAGVMVLSEHPRLSAVCGSLLGYALFDFAGVLVLRWHANSEPKESVEPQ
jgi:ABC-type multidrug transport system permease subunit